MTGRQVELLGRISFERYLKSQKWGYEFIDADGPGGLDLQMRGVDYILSGPEVENIEVELKTEQRFTGNFFLETWADAWNAQPGWLMTINPDVLAYQFLDVGRLYLMNFRDLKGWYFGSGRFVSGKRVKVSAHPTGRYTVGHIIPIEEIADNVNVMEIQLPHTSMVNEITIEALIHRKG